MPISSANRLRLFSFLFPPAGFFFLWTHPAFSFRRRVIGSLFLVLYSFLYAAVPAALLVRANVLFVEWPGGTLPRLTRSPTLPDYAKLEADRAQSRPPRMKPIPTTSYWTGFRGPNGNGAYTQTTIRTQWPPQGLVPIWKQPSGGGYASFSFGCGLAFTIEQRRDFEVVVAYDPASGSEVWTNAWTASFQESMGGDGPRATPAFFKNSVFALGAQGEFRCLNATNGIVLWRHDLFRENHCGNLTYGLAASPVVYDDKVMVVCGEPGAIGHTVAVYEAASGKPIWQALDDPAAYSTPMLVNLAGQRQLLVVTEDRAVGLAPENGAMLWSHPWKIRMGNRNIAQPVMVGTNRFLLSGGYGTGCELVEVAREGEQFTARSIWKNKNLKNKFTSSVLWEGFIYGLDEDILTCLNAQTGQRQWKGERYGYGQLLLAHGYLVILGGEGDLALVKADPSRSIEINRFPALRGKTWNYPAVENGLLFVRNAVEMACYDLRTK